MPTATYAVNVDWNNDGDYGDANEACVANVQSVSIERGRDNELGEFQAGTCEIVLDNRSGLYSPTNSGGALYGNLLPHRPVQVRATFNASTYDLFTGYIDRIVPSPAWDKRNCYLYCVDGMAAKLNTPIRLGMQTDQRPDQIVGAILDAVGWGAGASYRTIDTYPDETIPYAWWDEAEALQATYDIAASSLGTFYIGGDGKAVWEGRHHRLKEPHLTSQATYNDTMFDLTYDYGTRSIKNIISAEYTNRTVQSAAVIWLCPTVPFLTTAVTYELDVDFDDPVSSITTPVANTDYIANTKGDGTGTDVTSDVSVTVASTYAQGCKLEVDYTDSSSGENCYLTALQLRGTPVTADDPIKKLAEDATSQTAYGDRKYALQGKFFHSEWTAQDFVDYYLTHYKDPRPDVMVSLFNSDKVASPTSHFENMLKLEISDRITLVSSELGLNAAFYIERIEHEIRERGNYHETRWTVSPVQTLDYWILGTSELDTETRLAY